MTTRGEAADEYAASIANRGTDGGPSSDPDVGGFETTEVPGEEIIYVLEGALEYQIESMPTTVTAGDALTVAARAIHAVKNVGSGDAA
jgi:mannose-6-phosphate isomerase-like protein (cupin superfamily)